MPTSKNRTPSKCREWERDRRNRFNDALNQLGELVKRVDPESSNNSKESGAVQYAKIEIIQRAISFINELMQEKTQLGAKILSLQVNLEKETNVKIARKDASTQISKGCIAKLSSMKYNKLMLSKKSKLIAAKEKKEIPKKSVDHKLNIVNVEKLPVKVSHCPKLPNILPRSYMSEKKGSERAIVVIPAAPYVVPHRNLLMPAVPPTIVFVDSSFNCSGRTAIPIVPRVLSEITKTTMVNKLPITAYSHPLSIAKIKKGKMLDKFLITKNKAALANKKKNKVVKKGKTVGIKNKNRCDIIPNEAKKESFDEKGSEVHESTKIINSSSLEDKEPKSKVIVSVSNEIIPTNVIEKIVTVNVTTSEKFDSKQATEITKCIITTRGDKIKTSNKEKEVGNLSDKSEKHALNLTATDSDSNKKSCHPATILSEREKVVKVQPIMDTSLCENIVDGGNARLELAEEFLAASPTAAFLMSFPLVSGNRADSPAEDSHHALQSTSRAIVNNNTLHKRVCEETPTDPFFTKSSLNNEMKLIKNYKHTSSIFDTNFLNVQNKHKTTDNQPASKLVDLKDNNIPTYNPGPENPFLSLTIPPVLTSSCAAADSIFSVDFDCNFSKNTVPHTTYNTGNNLLFKNDPFSSVKNNIYSANNISSSHDFNALSLYPCAMEKYSSKSNKAEFSSVEDNFIKAGGNSRLTYDIDLGLSHKSFDFTNNSTNANNVSKENVFPSVPSSYACSTYNPFNPDFHMPIVTTTPNKKPNSKINGLYTDSVTNLYSQPSTFWPEDVPLYGNNVMNCTKSTTSKPQVGLPVDHGQTTLSSKHSRSAESKQPAEHGSQNKVVTHSVIPLVSDRNLKKSPSKMHINWMTSEVRSMQNNYDISHNESKEPPRPIYIPIDQQTSKKQEYHETNFFPIPMSNFSAPSINQEEFQVWPPARPLATAEISIEPPPINLPTLVGDLALGPHERKKGNERFNKGPAANPELANCNNFLSVTQLMDRSTDNHSSTRFHGPNSEYQKPAMPKNINMPQYSNGVSDKSIHGRIEANVAQPCYRFHEPKMFINPEISQYVHAKLKAEKLSEKNTKLQKNNYSAEALIRTGNCAQKVPDNLSTLKLSALSQKYSDYNTTQDPQMAQVSHFPTILDYPENNFANQQFPSTTLYSSTTNTISTSFYSNLIPGGSGIMATNYATPNFTSEFPDYMPPTECKFNYSKLETAKPKNMCLPNQDKPSIPAGHYKNLRKDVLTKHKMECPKKDANKKYQSKRPRIHSEIDDWTDNSDLFWQTRPSKTQANDEMFYPNYIGSHMPSQPQPDVFNAQFMNSATPAAGLNANRLVQSSFPLGARTNFNLSTIFPEIAKKVQ